jgi:hypothetical protein
MTILYDAVTAANIPANAAMVAGYDDGKYKWTPADWARFPNAIHVHITVFGLAGVLVCDCENGDLTPQQAAAWAHGEVVAHRRPTIYTSTSNHPAVVAALATVGLQFVRDVDWWEAHYDNDARLSPGSVAKQYQSTAAYDISITDGNWPAPPVPVVNTTHFPEDNMNVVTVTLAALDEQGNGWFTASNLGISDVNKIVSIVWITEPPAQVGRYDKLPDMWGIDADQQLVVSGGTPKAQYGARIWTTT